MCLIMTGKASDVRSTLINTPGLAGDIFKSNGDGIGIMYANKRGLKVIKKIPKKTRDVAELLLALPDDDRDLAIHWRMRTHGHVDLNNCHPYPVADGVAMMHNGVLSIGNASDTSRSDTYHFIEEYLKDAVAAHPALVHDRGFLTLVGDFIGGSNRFVFMTEDGRMSVVNYETGVEHGGVWFSNTYAWDPSLLIPNYKPRFVYSSRQLQWDEDDQDEYDNWMHKRSGQNYTALTHHKKPEATATSDDGVKDPHDKPGYWSDATEDTFLHAVLSYDASEIEWMLRRWPYSCMEATARCLEAYPMPPDPSNPVSLDAQRIIGMLEAGDYRKLADEARSRPVVMSKIMAQFVYWYEPGAVTPETAQESGLNEQGADGEVEPAPLTGELEFPADDEQELDPADIPESAYHHNRETM